MSKKSFKIAIMFLFALGVIFSSFFGYFKYKALNHHHIDFPYYFQFAVKAFNNNYTKHYTINPEGANYLGIGGIDGGRSLYQGLHMELIRYVEGAFVRVANNWPLAVFIIAPVLYYLILFYLLHIFKDRSDHERLLVFLLSFLYVLWPASIQSIAGFDLRPFAFLTPALLALLIAFYNKRPNWEILLFYNLIFLIREEAIVFNALFLAYYIFRNLGRLREKLKMILALLVSFFAGVSLIIFYYYIQNFPEIADPILRFYRFLPKFIILALAGSITSILLFYFWKRGKNIYVITDLLFPIVLLAPFILKTASASRTVSFFKILVFDPRQGILLAALITIALLLRDLSFKAGKIIFSAVVFLSIVVVGLFLFGSNSPVSAIEANYRKQTTELSKLWSWHKQLNRYQDRVITDTEGYKAFSDFENVLNYELLPQFITQKRQLRYAIFPENSIYLKDLFPKFQYVIIQQKNKESVEKFAGTNNFRLKITDADDHFIIYEIQNEI